MSMVITPHFLSLHSTPLLMAWSGLDFCCSDYELDGTVHGGFRYSHSLHTTCYDEIGFLSDQNSSIENITLTVWPFPRDKGQSCSGTKLSSKCDDVCYK